MMLPILISLSVTPGSYFFCAIAGTEAVAMITPESPSESPSVLMKSPVQCFMSPPRLLSDSSLEFSFLTAWTIAGVRVCRKQPVLERLFAA